MVSEVCRPATIVLASASLCRWEQLWVGLFLAVAMAMPTGAQAHLMSVGSGALHVREHDAVVLIGVPVAAFDGADDDGDGLLQPGEIRAHRTEILEQLARTFHLSVAGQVAVVREAHLMVSVHADDGVSAPQLEWWGLLDFASPPKATDCTEVGLQWFAGTNKVANDMVYTLQFRHRDYVQTAAFSKAQTLHSFQCAPDSTGARQ
jgi:hypothetical protein